MSADPIGKPIAPEDLYLFLKANARLNALISNASRPLGEKIENVEPAKLLTRKDAFEMLTLSVYPRFLDAKTTWDFYLFQNPALNDLKTNRLELMEQQIKFLGTLVQMKTNPKLNENNISLLELKQKIKANASNYQEKVESLEKNFFSSKLTNR